MTSPNHNFPNPAALHSGQALHLQIAPEQLNPPNTRYVSGTPPRARLIRTATGSSGSEHCSPTAGEHLARDSSVRIRMMLVTVRP